MIGWRRRKTPRPENAATDVMVAVDVVLVDIVADVVAAAAAVVVKAERMDIVGG